jgi:hypothetical protein
VAWTGGSERGFRSKLGRVASGVHERSRGRLRRRTRSAGSCATQPKGKRGRPEGAEIAIADVETAPRWSTHSRVRRGKLSIAPVSAKTRPRPFHWSRWRCRASLCRGDVMEADAPSRPYGRARFGLPVTKPDVADLDVSYGTSIRHSRGVRRRMRGLWRWRRSDASLGRPSIPHPELREVATDDADAVGTLHGDHEASAQLHAAR